MAANRFWVTDAKFERLICTAEGHNTGSVVDRIRRRVLEDAEEIYGKDFAVTQITSLRGVDATIYRVDGPVEQVSLAMVHLELLRNPPSPPPPPTPEVPEETANLPIPEKPVEHRTSVEANAPKPEEKAATPVPSAPIGPVCQYRPCGKPVEKGRKYCNRECFRASRRKN